MRPAVQKAANDSRSATNSAERKIVERNAQRFPASRRILRRSRFQKVYHEGSRSACSLFTVFIRAAEDDAPARVGITVTRKVGGAVVRNRAKRLLREAARKHWELFPAGLEVVLHARRAIVGRSGAEVEAELVRLLPYAVRRALRK